MQSGERIAINGRSYRLGAILSPGAGSYGQVWAAYRWTPRASPEVHQHRSDVPGPTPPSRVIGAHLERRSHFWTAWAEQSRYIVALLDHGQIDGRRCWCWNGCRPTSVMAGSYSGGRRAAPGTGSHSRLGQADFDGLGGDPPRRLVYRDLKLSNILIDDDGESARWPISVRSNVRTATALFVHRHSLPPMAPEQILPVGHGARRLRVCGGLPRRLLRSGSLLFSFITEQPTTEAQRRLGQLLALHGQEGAAQRGEQLGGLTEDERERRGAFHRILTVPALPEHGYGGAAALLTDLIEIAGARSRRPTADGDAIAVLDGRSGQSILPARPRNRNWDCRCRPIRRAGTRAAPLHADFFSPWVRRSVGLAGMLWGEPGLTSFSSQPVRSNRDREQSPDAVASSSGIRYRATGGTDRVPDPTPTTVADATTAGCHRRAGTAPGCGHRAGRGQYRSTGARRNRDAGTEP